MLGNPANACRRYDGLQLIGTRRFDGLGRRRSPTPNEKTFRLRTFVVGAYADFFSVTNLGRATLVHAGSGPYFGLLWGWTEPRTGRLRFRVSF
jgi:hypothetical protein